MYARLPPGVQYRVKPILDTIVNRLGTLVGSAYFATVLAFGISRTLRRCIVLVVAAASGVIALHMGRLSSTSITEHQADKNDSHCPPEAAREPPSIATGWLHTACTSGKCQMGYGARAHEGCSPGGANGVCADGVRRRDGDGLCKGTASGTASGTALRDGTIQEAHERRVALCWLGLFCTTGIGLGMTFELLQMHAGPASSSTFLTAVLGHWAQLLIAALLMGLRGRYPSPSSHSATGPTGVWTWPAAMALLASSLMNGAAQALDYTSQIAGGCVHAGDRTLLALPDRGRLCACRRSNPPGAVRLTPCSQRAPYWLVRLAPWDHERVCWPARTRA